MNIYIMRHGEAGYHASSDGQRALTAYGIKQSQQAGYWLKQQSIELDYALVSPYVRAQQTFSEVNRIVPVRQVEVEPMLTPAGSAALVADYLLSLSDLNIEGLLVVSHLPLVGYLVNQLCPSVAPPMFNTAAITCIHLSSQDTAIYQWMHSTE
ncbi:MAG: phosphohistidine phosphatase SixA [Candidatus Schmidhempelia sp.]|nr:phosphohistidine phosphatase SixA [Candidatus Schmidhempelia sp.]